MPVGRDEAARIRYQAADRVGKREMVLYSQCDEGRAVGLLRGYMVSDFNQLARIRNRKVITRGDKMKRKAEFMVVLARIAERTDKINNP